MGNKQEELKKLKWKYFWKQKIFEVWVVVSIIFVLWFGLSPLARLFDEWAVIFMLGGDMVCPNISFGCHLVYVFIGVIMLISILVTLYIIWRVICMLPYNLIKKWIECNLEKAEHRATEQLQKEKKEKRRYSE